MCSDCDNLMSLNLDSFDTINVTVLESSGGR